MSFPSDAAVEAAFDAYCSEGLGEAAFRESIRAALEAAYRVDARPLLDREAAIRRLGGSGLAGSVVDNLLAADLVRPMPTMQAIARTIYEQDMADGAVRPNPWERASDETRGPYERTAWAVLALLNGTSGMSRPGHD